MDMLRQLTELGVPVPLRAMAAAGGFNLDTLLLDQSEDLAIQRRLLEYKQRQNELKKEYGGGDDDMGGGFGSFSSTANMLPSISSRNFGESTEIVGKTVTGKKKYIHNQRKAQADANEMIFKSLSTVQNEGANMLNSSSFTPHSASKAELNALKNSGLF